MTEFVHDSTKRKILESLELHLGLAWVGGKTSFDLAEETGFHISTVRKTLRVLGKEGLAYAYAPRAYHRLDGKTANTLVWFRREANSIELSLGDGRTVILTHAPVDEDETRETIKTDSVELRA